MGKSTTSTAEMRDLLIAIWAVAPETVADWVPTGTRLDRLPGPDGNPVAFLEFRAAWRMDARWSPMPGGWGETYRLAELRVLARHGDQPAAVVIAAWIDHPTLARALAPISRGAEEARVELVVDGNPAIPGIDHMETSVRTDRTIAHVAVDAIPESAENAWGPRERTHGFFTDRGLAIHPSRIPRGKPVGSRATHDPLQTLPVRVTEARIDHPAARGIDPTHPVFAGWAPLARFSTSPFLPLRGAGSESDTPETAGSEPTGAEPAGTESGSEASRSSE